MGSTIIISRRSMDVNANYAEYPTLCKYVYELDGLAKFLSISRLSDFVDVSNIASELDAILVEEGQAADRELADLFDKSCPAAKSAAKSRWFRPDKAIKSLEVFLDYLAENDIQVVNKNDKPLLIDDLKGCHRDLTEIKKQNDAFHFAIVI